MEDSLWAARMRFWGRTSIITSYVTIWSSYSYGAVTYGSSFKSKTARATIAIFPVTEISTQIISLYGGCRTASSPTSTWSLSRSGSRWTTQSEKIVQWGLWNHQQYGQDGFHAEMSSQQLRQANFSGWNDGEWERKLPIRTASLSRKSFPKCGLPSLLSRALARKIRRYCRCVWGRLDWAGHRE